MGKRRKDRPALDRSRFVERHIEARLHRGTRHAFPDKAEHSLGAGLEHNWNLPNDAGLMARVQTSFRTAQYFSNYDFADSRQGNYTVSDAMLVYTAPNDRYEVQGYVRNLENSTYFTNAAESGTEHGYQYSFGAPRTFGIKVTAYFR